MSLFKLDKVEEIDLNNESSWKEGKRKSAPPPKDQAICLARLQVLAMSKNYLSPITYDVLQKQNE